MITVGHGQSRSRSGHQRFADLMGRDWTSDRQESAAEEVGNGVMEGSGRPEFSLTGRNAGSYYFMPGISRVMLIYFHAIAKVAYLGLTWIIWEGQMKVD
ncbi:hypothetical protein EVAR_78901_1 [Eumeta japonica]|uniref:Uncharacterized protein n=1 Tax=Eumeta variegata TaxID=151549 RepID=A0A4C1U392_EUMVA|nr:hypothetical protein EVAR_78901_1 [Eumeta japonica]